MSELRMPSINQVALSGRLMQDPEARQTDDGRLLITFTVGVNLNYVDKQGSWQKEITAVPVCASDKLAELAVERLAQGTAVFITGRLKSRGAALEVAARHIQFLDPEEEEKEENEEPEPCASPSK